MKRDTKIKISLTVFLCSITLITLIKGTYAFPTSLQNNGDSGRIVPLGGDDGEIGYVCFYCPNSGSYSWSKENDAPESNCYQLVYSQEDCHAPSPSPSPSKTPTPTKTPTKTPTPVIPTSTPKHKNCYKCEITNTYIYGYSDNLPGCDSVWVNTGLSESNCHATVTPPPTNTPTPSPDNACYVCSNDENIYYWGEQPSSGSNSCSSSWKKTTKSQNQCYQDIPSNPNTGDVLLYIAYLVGFSSLFYSGYNFYKYKKQNNRES